MKPVLLNFFLLLFIACSPHQVVQLKMIREMSSKSMRSYARPEKNKARIVSSSSDRVIETASYVNDTLDGKRIIFDREGNKEIEETYVMGVYEGPVFDILSQWAGQDKWFIRGRHHAGNLEKVL